jgi:hypothetical protein
MQAVFSELKKEKREYDVEALKKVFALIKTHGGRKFTMKDLQAPPKIVHFEVEANAAFANAIRANILTIPKYHLSLIEGKEFYDDRSILTDDINTKLLTTPITQDFPELFEEDEKRDLVIFIAKRNETSVPQEITVDDIRIAPEDDVEKIFSDVMENLEVRVKETRRDLEKKLLPLRATKYGMLQSGKFFVARLKVEVATSGPAGVQGVIYECLDVEPFDSEKNTGTPSTMASPRKHRIGFEVLETITPKIVFERVVEKMRGELMRMKKDVEGYDDGEYFSSQFLTVSKKQVYVFEFGYGSFQLAAMVARTVSELDEENFVASTARNNAVGCVIKIRDEPKKQILAGIDLCLSGVDAMERQFVMK